MFRLTRSDLAILTLTLSVLLLPTHGQAQNEPATQESVQEAVQEKVEDLRESVKSTRGHRTASEYFGLVTYAPVDFIVFHKIGASAGLVMSPDFTWELEYIGATLSFPSLADDLGGVKDRRLSLIGRRYPKSNSFNLWLGLSYMSLSAHISNDMINRVSGGNSPDLDLIEINSVGLTFGFGNRWIFDNGVTFGVDWLAITQNLSVLDRKSTFLDRATNPQDRESIERVIDLISSFPRITLLKLQLGYIF